MTSPGLIERSINSTNPLTKFAAIDCRPNPNPKPMAPVNTVRAVRSTPAAFNPMRMLRPIRKALANFAMPMRVEGASVLSFLSRRSTQRLIQAATSTNRVSVNNSLSIDHTVMRLLPAATPTLSSALMMGSSQPRYSAAMASHSANVTRFSQCCIHDLLPRLAVNRNTPTRTTT